MPNNFNDEEKTIWATTETSTILKRLGVKKKVNFTHQSVTKSVRFQVPKAASMNMTVFWYVALFSMIEDDRRFRGAYCHQFCQICYRYRIQNSKDQSR
jgi:hypothetical protein